MNPLYSAVDRPRRPFGCLCLCLAAGLASLALACAPTTTQAPPAAPPSSSADTVQLPTTYVTPSDAGTLQQRFDSAHALLREAKYKEAAAAFDAIVDFEPQGPLAAASRFNAGFAYEQADDRTSALARYREVVRRFPAGVEGRSALLRASRILSWREDWEQLTAYSDMLLARADLSPIEQVEAYGGRALGLVEQGQIDQAVQSVSRARTIIEEQGWGDAGTPPVAAAQVFFALGEVRRVRSERLTFSPVPPNFAEVLEERCQALLDAQEAYAQAMRAHDPHWAAMAGYRVGQLYQQLHRDVMAVPPPSSAKTEKQKQLFEGAMQLRYRVLLEKGLKMMDKTLEMAQRTGEDSSWVHRARDAKRDLEQALLASKEAMAKLPYTEADLQRALESLSAKKKDEATAP